MSGRVLMSSMTMDVPGMAANNKSLPSSVTANASGVRKHRLFSSSVLEPSEELDERHEKCYALICDLTADKSEKEAHEAMAAAVSNKDPRAHDDVCLGLVVGILGDPEMAGTHYRDLTLVSRDGMTFAVNHLSMLVLDKYTRMQPGAKQQLIWLTREMIKSSLQGMDNICWNLMRQIAGGDVSRPNLWLADQLLDILIENRAWLEKFPFLLASVVYTYLRLMEDHAQYAEKLKEKEVPFIVSLIRERFTDVIVIGRDFMRVLQHVAKIPEIEQLWNDILNNPKCLSPTYTGITQIMQTRTSRRFLQSRITPDMEKKLVFLTSHVRFGTHKRYQEWFQRQYLSTPESQSLRCDLIRFIVGVFHPTNELLCSDIIPRWAVIGWLLTTCTSTVAASHAKLALFYDWLFFVPQRDNIMNIEPAVLVMHHSMKPHPAITATLLDFLCRIITNFYPRESNLVRDGIFNSLRQILEKRVLPSLSPLFDNPRLDRELKTMLHERFAPFCNGGGGKEDMDDLPFPEREEYSETSARFSDDEDDSMSGSAANSKAAPAPVVSESAPPPKASLARRSSSKLEANSSGGAGEESLPESVREIVKELRSEEDSERQCEVMDRLLQAVVSDEQDVEQLSGLASQLSEVLHGEFEGRIFPSEDPPSAEAIEDSIGRPLFVVFRSLCEMTDSDRNRTTLLQLLAELYTLRPRIGYYLLYFLSADKTAASASLSPKDKAAVYRDLCETIDEKNSLDICLVNDMRQCQEDDVNLFVYLIPEVFTWFPKQSVGNVDLLYLIVSCVDGRHVQKLVCHVLAKEFLMFKKDSFGAILNSSLSWETFEQYAFWQLFGAHDLPIECILPVIPRLSFMKHAEALTFVMMHLKQERPTAELLKHLLAREVQSGDKFVTSALSYWIPDYDEKLGDLISHHLRKQASGGSGGGVSGVSGGSGVTGKRKRTPAATGAGSSLMSGLSSLSKGNSALSHSAELCLLHLDALRQTTKQDDFFAQKSIQVALQQVRQTCADSQKKKFMDLFAMADSDSDSEEQHQQKAKKGKTSGKSPGKAKSAKSSAKASGSSDESSDGSENERQSARSSGSKPRASSSSSRGKNPRKRPIKVSSYKISSEESSDDDSEVTLKKMPKKRRKSDSD